jgi:hypothetical protein
MPNPITAREIKTGKTYRFETMQDKRCGGIVNVESAQRDGNDLFVIGYWGFDDSRPNGDGNCGVFSIDELLTEIEVTS